VVMNAGNIEQTGTPHDIYNRPATRFVAAFVGQLNHIEAVVADPAARAVTIDGQPATLPALPEGAAAGTPVTFTLRPEMLSIGPRPGNDVTLAGTVADVSFLGSVIRMRVSLGRNVVSLDTFNDRRAAPPARGEPVTVSLSSRDLLAL